MSYLFTSESVSEGHPDKVADLISDAVATYILDKNTAHRAAIETLVTTNMVTLAGEYKSTKEIDKSVIADIVRNTVKRNWLRARRLSLAASKNLQRTTSTKCRYRIGY